MKKAIKIGALVLAVASFTFTNAQEDNKKSPEKMFERLDADNNGEITLEEWKAKKIKKETKEAIQEKRFAKMDSNGNKSLTIDEFKEAITKMKKVKERKKAKALSNENSNE